MYSSRPVKKKSWGRVGSRTSIHDQVGAAENFWDHFAVAKRKGLGTAGLGNPVDCRVCAFKPGTSFRPRFDVDRSNSGCSRCNVIDLGPEIDGDFDIDSAFSFRRGGRQNHKS